MALSEATRLMIQKKVSQSLGVDISVRVSNETGEIELFKSLKVVRKPSMASQIELSDAKQLNPSAKIGDNIEVPLDVSESTMIQCVIDSCLDEATKTEETLKRKQEMVAELSNELKVKGVIEYSLIFATFEKETMVGDAIFRYEGKYEVRLEKDRRIDKDVFEVGKDYPMIILSFEERKDTVIIQASRVTNNLVSELIRMSLVNCDVDVEIKKVFRIPGKLARVVVDCPDNKYNPSGIVVGYKGSRIQTVESYLSGEKVEILNYAPCTPLQIQSIVGDGFIDLFYYFENPDFFKSMRTINKKRAVVIVKDEFVSRVIGKGGSALNLLNRITGWVIHVTSQTEFATKYSQNLQEVPVDFDWSGAGFNEPFLDRFFGYYLSKCGFKSLEECADLSMDSLSQIQELSQDDKEFLLGHISGLSFLTVCPNCGAEIPSTSLSCPKCGAMFEVQ